MSHPALSTPNSRPATSGPEHRRGAPRMTVREPTHRAPTAVRPVPVSLDPSYILALTSIRASDRTRVGGTAALLGELKASGFDVPDGFAIAASAFEAFARHQDLASARPQAVERAPVPTEVAQAIRAAYDALCESANDRNLAVTVRSSASSDDHPEAPFADPEDAFLNVQGADGVIENARRCWVHHYERATQGQKMDSTRCAVVVQRMIASQASGVAFTLDPVKGDLGKVVIESTLGLSWAPAGEGDRDRVIVGKASGAIVSSRTAQKRFESVLEGGRIRRQAVHLLRQTAPSLTPEEAMRLAQVAIRIEGLLGAPHGIGFTVEWLRDQRFLRIVHVWPETS